MAIDLAKNQNADPILCHMFLMVREAGTRAFIVGLVRGTGFEYVVFTEKNSLFDPKVTKR
jgi:hypothetical protein